MSLTKSSRDKWEYELCSCNARVATSPGECGEDDRGSTIGCGEDDLFPSGVCLLASNQRLPIESLRATGRLYDMFLSLKQFYPGGIASSLGSAEDKQSGVR